MRTLRDLSLVVPVLGGAAFALTLAGWSLFGSHLLLTDDPSVLALTVVAGLAPSVAATAAVRGRGGSERASAWAFAAPVVAWCLLGAVVGPGAELHGPGLVLILCVALVVAAFGVYHALALVSRSYVLRATSWVATGLWLIGFASAPSPV